MLSLSIKSPFCNENHLAEKNCNAVPRSPPSEAFHLHMFVFQSKGKSGTVRRFTWEQMPNLEQSSAWKLVEETLGKYYLQIVLLSTRVVAARSQGQNHRKSSTPRHPECSMPHFRGGLWEDRAALRYYTFRRSSPYLYPRSDVVHWCCNYCYKMSHYEKKNLIFPQNDGSRISAKFRPIFCWLHSNCACLFKRLCWN